MRRISVCMATYNGEKYIREQIVSILGQLKQFDELIISDDGSNDGTLEIVRSFNDDRIKIVYNSLGKGYSQNFENAIKSALGEIIFLSDQDDVWFGDKVEKMLVLLEDSQLVVSNAQFVDENLDLIKETFFSLRGGQRGFLNNLYKSRYLGACMAFRKEIYSKLFPFPSNRNLCPHDLWITLIAEFYFKVSTIDEPLIYYRRHGENVSTGGSFSENTIYKKIYFRCYSLLKVMTRLFK